MKAEGSLLKPAQHTNGMDSTFFQPVLSRGFLCLTKLVKYCAAPNKQLKMTVRLSSWLVAQNWYKVICVVFYCKRENLFCSSLGLNIFYFLDAL